MMNFPDNNLLLCTLIIILLLINCLISYCDVINAKKIVLWNKPHSESGDNDNGKLIFINRRVMSEVERISNLYNTGYNITFCSNKNTVSFSYSKIEQNNYRFIFFYSSFLLIIMYSLYLPF